jgi:serine/arginine repetitive matrix protein 2
MRDTNGVNGDGVQVFVKEHGMNSNPSFLSRKKSQGRPRPETKVSNPNVTSIPNTNCVQVFYSSSAQIGRLIENLSQGMDAGSFNILPNTRSGHSHSSSLQSESDIHWTVEERLEHMLGSLGST